MYMYTHVQCRFTCMYMNMPDLYASTCTCMFVLFPLKFVSALTQLLRVHRGQAREISEVRTLYQKEALKRKLLYNEVNIEIVI